jgi:hypothetical protein
MMNTSVRRNRARKRLLRCANPFDFDSLNLLFSPTLKLFEVVIAELWQIHRG